MDQLNFSEVQQLVSLYSRQYFIFGLTPGQMTRYQAILKLYRQMSENLL